MSKHIAMIMDGNRRWAARQGLAPEMGHWKGAEVITPLVRAAKEAGVRTLTLYAFSTENWVRAPEEIEALMHILAHYLEKKRPELIEEGVRLSAIGDLGKLPEKVVASLEETRRATAEGVAIDLILALNYGGRDELRRATAAIARKVQEGALTPEAVTETLIADHLDTAPWGDPDLLVRTSGEYRLSNFLLWQASYAEVYVTDVLWPDFTPAELRRAIDEYNRRARRHGE